MTTRKLGNSGLEIPALVFGGNVFGWTADESTSFRLLDALLDAGLNCIDTADVYSRWVPGHQGGESETLIGKWLDSKGKVITKDIKVRLNEGNKKAIFTHERRLRKVEKSIDVLGDPIEDKAEVYRILTERFNYNIVNLREKGFERDFKNEERIRKFLFKVERVVKLKDDINIRGFLDTNTHTLYLSERFFNKDGTIDTIALFHELGEGSLLSLPHGLNKHTYLRGLGKDIRLILDKLIEKDLINDNTPLEEIINLFMVVSELS